MYDDLDIVVRDPLWRGGNFEQHIDQYSAYGHVINAVGGFWNATLTIPVRRERAEEWYANGLGRDVTVYNPNLGVAFEGFVNVVRAAVGTLTVTRGPLVDIANRVRLVYSTINTDTTPPLLGIRKATATVNDTASQTRYGVIEKVLSTGGTTDATALQIRDTYLAENKDPQTSQDLAIGGENQTNLLTLEILGYVHWLGLYTYTETTSGTRTYTLRLQDVINADPNSIISADFTQIDTNSATVPRYDNDDRKGWAVIKDILAKGNTSNQRYTFGIYENRRAYYTVLPDELVYFHQLADNKQRILTPTNAEVKIWDVRPARWLQVSDWLVGRSPARVDIRDDQRNMFIESVNYTAPDSLRINGKKVDTLPQLLGRLGLTGIGA